MGIMDKMITTMKLNSGMGDDEYYDDDYGYDEMDPAETGSGSDGEEKAASPIRKIAKPAVSRSTSSKKSSGNGMEVCVIKPTTVEEAREITDTLLANRTVVLNLEGLDVDIAQRIIDFTSGSTYAMRGNLQKISHYIFIVTPPSVDISGDFQDVLAGTFDVPMGN